MADHPITAETIIVVQGLRSRLGQTITAITTVLGIVICATGYVAYVVTIAVITTIITIIVATDKTKGLNN